MSIGYEEAARLIAVASSVVVTWGTYAQVWQMWKTRSVRDISSSLIWLSSVNEVTWLNYGFAIHEWPLMLVGLANLPACVLAIWAELKFRSHSQPHEPHEPHQPEPAQESGQGSRDEGPSRRA